MAGVFELVLERPPIGVSCEESSLFESCRAEEWTGGDVHRSLGAFTALGLAEGVSPRLPTFVRRVVGSEGVVDTLASMLEPLVAMPLGAMGIGGRGLIVGSGMDAKLLTGRVAVGAALTDALFPDAVMSALPFAEGFLAYSPLEFWVSTCSEEKRLISPRRRSRAYWEVSVGCGVIGPIACRTVFRD